MAPTLPQLPQSQDGRVQAKQHSEPNNNTLPQLNKSDGLTRQPSFLTTPRDKDKTNRNRTDDYGNPLPLTPAGKFPPYLFIYMFTLLYIFTSFTSFFAFHNLWVYYLQVDIDLGQDKDWMK